MSFVITGETGKVPKDAKLISSDDLTIFYDRVIDTWNPSSQIWALVRGPTILGAASALSGIYLNSIFRRKFRLGAYGQFATYLPIAVLPTLMSIAFHKQVIQNEIILNPMSCPLCTHMKSTMLQLGVGVVQPYILASASTLFFATRHFTLRFPQITTNPKGFVKFYLKVTRPMAYPMVINIALQTLLVQFITYKERQHFFILNQEMTKDIPRNESVELRTV